MNMKITSESSLKSVQLFSLLFNVVQQLVFSMKVKFSTTIAHYQSCTISTVATLQPAHPVSMKLANVQLWYMAGP